MKRRSTFALLGGAAATALMGTGCGGGTASGSVLTVGMPNGPLTENNNPFSPTSASNSLGYRWVLYEPLAQVNLLEPTNEPLPWLAEKWEWSKDFQSVKLTIRDGVKWSDGKDLTADDVAFTYNLVKDTEALNLDAIPYKKATATGRIVELTFKSPQYVNQTRIIGFTPIVPEHVWSKVKDPTKDTVKKPVGSGPFTLSSWTSQAVTLKVRDDYWGDKPKVKEMRYVSYNDNSAQTTALGNGECQWSYVFMPDYKKVFIKKDPENHRLWFPSGLGIHVLFINNARKPFDDPELRKAMNLVVDREAVHKQGESGLYPLVESPTGIPSPVGDDYIADKYKNVKHKVDVKKAKKILEDAGYTLKGGKLETPDGKAVTMKLIDPTGWSDYLASLQIIADNLSTIGIKAEVDSVTVDDWNEKLFTGDFDASLHWTNTGSTPWDLFSNIMDGAHYKEIGEKASWNFGRFKSDEATEALSTYADTDDEDTRKKALETLQDIMVEEVPVIPLVAGPIGAVFSTKHWVGWPDDDNPYSMSQPTQPSSSLILTRLKPA
ncbi:ABC transporter substrate-binding protein [Stackebrandtia nassauensis]|uniref:Extracellular solute-binding protein family 5 n=1 Tax=Stackebrandtia nassauensis (strain DSM 44728 / CIP 108903 / NRRL B-16338 / NBRC 102104 / LLR-40K-21) TaxID=446470 RepID=D3Q6C7_STANL|nr:ABC transporter substrate-binding protein [Stackebrandtia nassauensis]ADD42302.1 extracellular solute-binding protein family 5 [Stackebrandtia nassauensis DSM 44728]